MILIHNTIMLLLLICDVAVESIDAKIMADAMKIVESHIENVIENKSSPLFWNNIVVWLN